MHFSESGEFRNYFILASAFNRSVRCHATPTYLLCRSCRSSTHHLRCLWPTACHAIRSIPTISVGLQTKATNESCQETTQEGTQTHQEGDEVREEGREVPHQVRAQNGQGCCPPTKSSSPPSRLRSICFPCSLSSTEPHLCPTSGPNVQPQVERVRKSLPTPM